MTGSPAMSSHLTVVLESNSHVAKLRRALYCIYQSIRRVEDKATMKMREGGGGGSSISICRSKISVTCSSPITFSPPLPWLLLPVLLALAPMILILLLLLLLVVLVLMLVLVLMVVILLFLINSTRAHGEHISAPDSGFGNNPGVTIHSVSKNVSLNRIFRNDLTNSYHVCETSCIHWSHSLS